MLRPRTFVVLAMLLLVPTLAATELKVISQAATGAPGFLNGDLGTIDSPPAAKSQARDETLFRLSARNTLQGILVEYFGASGIEEMEILRVQEDDLGTVHVRFQQHMNGLPVIGAQMYLHARVATGEVYAVNGEFAPGHGAPPPTARRRSAGEAVRELARRGFVGRSVNNPALLYFHDAETGLTHLSWKVRMQGKEAGNFFDNDVYVDALTGEVVAVDAKVHTAQNRETYDATGSVVGSTGITGLPGTLACDELFSLCGDAAAQRAHDGAAEVYAYYEDRFGRDSLDDSGMTLVSSVHVGNNWGNAAWYNNQMIYGDGDGFLLDDLTLGFDVIAHEFTHGVTDFESQLLYQKESGALNEALSDIFGVSADSHSRGGIVDASTWQLGEEVFTPTIPGDALRYMNDPDLDNYSKGYYPERLHPGPCTPSNSNDQCGVHGNSGIANLAYFLLVEGGTHPRGKTTVDVPAIGMAMAEQIFYRAQTTCLTASSDFEAARHCTAQAATELFGATESSAVHDAWDAVGVPGAGPGGGSSHVSIGINGCFAGPGLDYFQCYATASGGSGEYNYWWMFSGNGQLYQTNSPSATVSQCSGPGTLTVQVLDRVTREISRSAPHRIVCGGCGPGPGFCEE